MFTLLKPYVYCIYLDDINRKEEVNMEKNGVNVK